MDSTSSPPRKTPLHAVHLESGARMAPFGGWDMPLQYAGQLREHEAVRTAWGVFDVSHMGQVRFRGPRALAFLDTLVAGRIARLADHQSLYTVMCNPRGGVIDDLIVTRLGAEHAFAVINAATSPSDIAWMREAAGTHGFGDVEIIDECDQWAMIAVQGPCALQALERLQPGPKWTETPAFSFHELPSNGEPVLVSRTGYTGEAGFELLCRPAVATGWWQAFVAAGAAPCGLAARDSLRLEMGYSLYGNDLSESISPYEGGVGWTVALDKEAPFIGKEALAAQKESGVPRRRIGLRVDGRRPLRRGDTVTADGEAVGEVTSGGFSPTGGFGIGLAIVRADAARRDVLAIARNGRTTEVSVHKPPFIQK